MISYEEIVRDHSRNIYAVAMMMVNDESTASDITQDVFIRIYKGLKGFKGKSDIGTWIYRITRNACYDFFSKNKRLPDEFNDESEQIHSIENNPEDEYEKDWEQKMVRKALGSLPVDQRMALSLYYYFSRSYEEIGSTMKIPVGTVKSHIYRGKENLKKILTPVLEVK